jgi:hypothetical protein
METTMLKHLWTCAALAALGTGSANAQQQDALLQKLAVQGASFDIILAMPKSPTVEINLGNSPDALVLHLVGGELALTFDDAEKMLKALVSLQLPVCSFHVESPDGKSRRPISIYIAPVEKPLNSTEK